MKKHDQKHAKNDQVELGKKKLKRKLKRPKSKKGLFHIGENEQEIIKAVGRGLLLAGIFAIAASSPKFPKVLYPLIKRGLKDVHKKIKRLEEKGMIYLGPDKIRLTKKGRQILKEITISDVEIPVPKKWDKTWHLVSYDIPVEKSQKRDWFRHKLQEFGFRKIQESLWVYPYNCREQIALIANWLGISKNVVLMQASTVPNQKSLEKEFKLT